MSATTTAEPIRRVHLGVDFGTSQSKLVFRDYARRGGAMHGEYAVVVRPPDEAAERADFRIPSSVSYADGVLHFGSHAEARAATKGVSIYRSLKMLVALPEHFHGLRMPLPEGLSVEDLATLYIVHLIHLGQSAVRRYLAKEKGRVSLTMTLGVPMSELDNPHLKNVFLRLACTAVQMYRTGGSDWSKGLRLADARNLVAAARKTLPPLEQLEPADWVRAEAPAALIWAFRSPRVSAGLYAVVDVGAGTTSSSWFRIKDANYEGRWVKSQMAFYGAACRPPGADAVEELIARTIDVANPADLRGRVNEVIEKLGRDAFVGLDEIVHRIFRTYQAAFGESYKKYRQQSYWQDAKLFLIGGGTLIDPIRERFRQPAWNLLRGAPPLVDAGHPADLHEEDGRPYADDPRFLLVAYGLSHFGLDVPEIASPNEIPEFKPAPLPERAIHHEEIYFGK